MSVETVYVTRIRIFLHYYHKENVHQITIRTCLEDIEKFLIILNKEALKRVKICTNTKDFEKNFIDIFEFNERFSNELNEKKGK